MNSPLVWALILPIVGTAFILLFRDKPNAREGASLVTASILCWLVWWIYGAVKGGASVAVVLAEPIPGILAPIGAGGP